MTAPATLAPDDPAWRSFVDEHESSPTQRPGWLGTITSAYGLKARIVALKESDGSILAGLPMVRSKLPWRKRWTALPFTDVLEPVAIAAEHRDALLSEVGRSASEPIVVRTRAEQRGWCCRQVGTVQVLDLTQGMDAAMSDAHPKTRQNVKRARRADVGLDAHPITTRQEFLGPSAALIARSRKRLGAPTQPRRFWTRVWELHERGEALTIGVYLRGELVANEIALLGRRHAAFKYSASDWSTRHLGTNYLALATALEMVAARGIESVDFGFTDLRNDSLRAYKARWGGAERPAYFSSTDRALLPDSLEPGRLLTGAIRHTPVFVGRTVGSLAYPFVA